MNYFSSAGRAKIQIAHTRHLARCARSVKNRMYESLLRGGRVGGDGFLRFLRVGLLGLGGGGGGIISKRNATQGEGKAEHEAHNLLHVILISL